MGRVLALGGIVVGGALSVPLIRFALHPIFGKATETDWADLGPVGDFTEVNVPQKRTITVNQLDGWRRVISEKSVYVIRGEGDKLTVLSAICPHLGCSVRWNDSTTRFACPCHNGTFAESGKLLSGPPPRDMDELDSRIADGHLQVRYQAFRQLVPTKEVLA
jgi:Rieske Fe-S protein